MTLRRPATAILCIAVACCSPPAPEPTPAPPRAQATPPAPTPSPTRTATATPPRQTTWMDAPATPGDWRYVSGSQRTSALFGATNSEPRFSVTCDKSRRTITLERAGAANGPVPMRIRTETRDGALTANPSGGTLPAVTVALSARDPILDAMAFSKGRFAIETPGMPTLYIPSWTELTRVIEDCR